MKKQIYIKPKIISKKIISYNLRVNDNFNLFDGGQLLADCSSCACCEYYNSAYRCCNN